MEERHGCGNGGEVSTGDPPPPIPPSGVGEDSLCTVGVAPAEVVVGGMGGMDFGGGCSSGGFFSNGAVKRKRGRPKKFVPGGVHGSGDDASVKKKRGRPRGSGNFARFTSPGDLIIPESRPFVSCFPSYSSLLARRETTKASVGSNFTPYVEIVRTGEDVVGKILSFSQKGSGALCVLSATGIVSSVTVNQPGSSSGSTLTYEGRFEILTLSGSYIFCETDISTHKIGMLSVSLAKSDGGVFGGSISGSLVAAGPVQLVVGCFNQTPKEEVRPVWSAEVPTASGMAPANSGQAGGSGRLSSSGVSEPENEDDGNTAAEQSAGLPSMNNSSWSGLRAARPGPEE